MEELKRRFILAVGLIALVISFGTAGYMVIEEWNFLDALYQIGEKDIVERLQADTTRADHL